MPRSIFFRQRWSANAFRVRIFAALVTVHVGRSIAGPISKLRAGADRIAKGDLDTPIEVASPDEFGALASQFDGMALGSLERATSRSARRSCSRRSGGAWVVVPRPWGGMRKAWRAAARRAIEAP